MSAALLHHLTREHAAIGGFLELLELEAHAMTKGDFSALPALALSKSELADQIMLLTDQREQAQLAMGYAADRAGADACAAAGSKTLKNAWFSLRERAALAREHNHRNGAMIHAHLDFTRQSIGFLQSRGHPLYGPDGSHHAGAASGNCLAVG